MARGVDLVLKSCAGDLNIEEERLPVELMFLPGRDSNFAFKYQIR